MTQPTERRQDPLRRAIHDLTVAAYQSGLQRLAERHRVEPSFVKVIDPAASPSSVLIAQTFRRGVTTFPVDVPGHGRLIIEVHFQA